MLILKYTNIITFQLYLVILGVHVVILKIKSMFNSLKNTFSYLANQYKTCLEKVIKHLEHTMLQIFNGICTLSLNLPTNLACTEKN